MRHFITRHATKIIGVLSGFDRIVFRGTLLRLCYPKGVKAFLDRQGALLKDFGSFAQTVTDMLRDAVAESIDRLEVPTRYIESSRVRKEEVARRFLEERPIHSGPICVLSAVEPCLTWQVFRSKLAKTQELRRRTGKCLHYYHYFLHPEFGLMHVRVQTWMPYTIQICINGREWLGQQLRRARLRHEQVDNCFPCIADPSRAQAIMDEFSRLPWTQVLGDVARVAEPALDAIVGATGHDYYWTVHQSEWATDLMFDGQDALASLYPSLVRYAVADLQSADVLRFLGKKPSPNFLGEVTTDFKRRVEGVRVKHVVCANSVKMYDKQGSVLRIETTINRPDEFKIRRRAQGDPDSDLELRPLRKTVVDLPRAANIAQAANKRYLEALAVADDPTPLERILDPLAQRATLGDQRVRGLRPLTDDVDLLHAIGRGEFTVNGFRNRDLVEILFPGTADQDRRRVSAKITRLLRILRAHRIIEKVVGTHRYVVTAHGRQAITAIRLTRQASLSKLQQCA